MKRSISVMIALAFVIGANILSANAESDTSAAVAVVTTLLSNITRNDQDGASKLFVEQPDVTDAFPPFRWHGTTAFKEWMADFPTDSAKNKDTDFKFTVGKPLTQVVVGDRANVIVAVVLDLKERGKPNRYDGLANVVLLKTADVWKIAAFTWTTK
jgi:hypothetical protein